MNSLLSSIQGDMKREKKAYKLVEKYESLDYFIIIGNTNCAMTSTEKNWTHFSSSFSVLLKNQSTFPFQCIVFPFRYFDHALVLGVGYFFFSFPLSSLSRIFPIDMLKLLVTRGGEDSLSLSWSLSLAGQGEAGGGGGRGEHCETRGAGKGKVWAVAPSCSPAHLARRMFSCSFGLEENGHWRNPAALPHQWRELPS